MKFSRKLIAALMAALLVCLSLVGCGKSKPDSADDSTPTDAGSGESAVATPDAGSAGGYELLSFDGYPNKVAKAFNWTIALGDENKPDADLSQASEGQVVFFAGYEWKVLERQSDKVLLLSNDIIAENNYMNNADEPFWSSSHIRAWLNDEFYNLVFTKKQQAQILTTHLENDSIRNNKLDLGGATDDKVFLLNTDELEKYFGGFPVLGNKLLLAKAIPALEMANYNSVSGEAQVWLTRDPGFDDEESTGSPFQLAGEANNVSVVGTGGGRANISSPMITGVRPAIWVSVK